MNDLETGTLEIFHGELLTGKSLLASVASDLIN